MALHRLSVFQFLGLLPFVVRLRIILVSGSSVRILHRIFTGFILPYQANVIGARFQAILHVGLFFIIQIDIVFLQAFGTLGVHDIDTDIPDNQIGIRLDIEGYVSLLGQFNLEPRLSVILVQSTTDGFPVFHECCCVPSGSLCLYVYRQYQQRY